MKTRSEKSGVVLRVALFGEIRLVGKPGPSPKLATSRDRALIAYLALRCGTPVPRETLIDALWPNADIDQGRNRLSTSLSHIRSALTAIGVSPDDVLVADRKFVKLASEGVEVDVAEFERLAQRAQLAPHEDDKRALLQQALDLYTSQLAIELFDDWILIPQVSLSSLFEKLAWEMVRLGIRSGDHATALITARSWVEKVPESSEAIHAVERAKLSAEIAGALPPSEVDDVPYEEVVLDLPWLRMMGKRMRGADPGAAIIQLDNQLPVILETLPHLPPGECLEGIGQLMPYLVFRRMFRQTIQMLDAISPKLSGDQKSVAKVWKLVCGNAYGGLRTSDDLARLHNELANRRHTFAYRQFMLWLGDRLEVPTTAATLSALATATTNAYERCQYLMRAGWKCQATHEGEESIRYFTQALNEARRQRVEMSEYVATSALAYALYPMGLLFDAEVFFSRKVDLDRRINGSQHRPDLTYGSLLYDRGFRREGVEEIDRALAFEVAHGGPASQLHTVETRLALSLHDMDLATARTLIRRFEELISLIADPLMVNRPHIFRARLALASAQPLAAMRHLDEVTRTWVPGVKGSGDHRIMMLIAETHARLGDARLAMRYAREALELSLIRERRLAVVLAVETLAAAQALQSDQLASMEAMRVSDALRRWLGFARSPWQQRILDEFVGRAPGGPAMSSPVVMNWFEQLGLPEVNDRLIASVVGRSLQKQDIRLEF
ncbi:MAG: hypothetical protein LCH41_09660 [Armatimonadetes bacterium]|nr:hypothetical protein [Armatimonadota bacterium]